MGPLVAAAASALGICDAGNGTQCSLSFFAFRPQPLCPTLPPQLGGARFLRLIGEDQIYEFRGDEASIVPAACTGAVLRPELRPRFSRQIVCDDPYLVFQDNFDALGVRDAWLRVRPSDPRYAIVVDDGIVDHLEFEVHMRFSVNNVAPGEHGVRVAGMIAAEANGMGICGVDPGTRLVDVHLIHDLFSSDLHEAVAFYESHVDLNGVYCNSWGPVDDGRCEAPGPYMRMALENGIAHGRSGRGAIYIFAGGNGGPDENMNNDGYANSVYTIAVGALYHRGGLAPFSEWGACIAVVALGTQVISTEGDENFAYFHGTSAAAPAVCGTVSLMLAVNPELSWRDVQEILAHSATLLDGANWQRNSGGFSHHYNFGFGALNTSAAVRLAEEWHIRTSSSASSASLQQSTPTPAVFFLPVHDNFFVEQVRVCVSIQGEVAGALGIWAISPRGTESILSRPTTRVSAVAGCTYDDWCFTTLRSWGEESAGVWQVHIESFSRAFEVSSANLTVFGTDEPFRLYGCAADELE